MKRIMDEMFHRALVAGTFVQTRVDPFESLGLTMWQIFRHFVGIPALAIVRAKVARGIRN